jgi:hypothetical protein
MSANKRPPLHYSGLSGGISLNDLINALQDPEKRFEFPVKPWSVQTGFDQSTKNALFITAGILGTAAILTAIIVSNERK